MKTVRSKLNTLKFKRFTTTARFQRYQDQIIRVTEEFYSSLKMKAVNIKISEQWSLKTYLLWVNPEPNIV